MKTQKKTKNANKQTKVRNFSINIPDKDLMELIRLDCAMAIEKAGKDFFADVKAIKQGKKFIDFSSPDMRKVCKVVAAILEIIQNEWKAAMRKYADSTKLPKGFVPKGCKGAKLEKAPKAKGLLSNDEKATIRALRKSGLSIKAIGKEIHRAEKVVRDFVKTLPF